MRYHHITVGRTARYAVLGDPTAETCEVWFVCHGYGLLAAEFIDRFRALDDGSRVVVAPEGLSRFYTNHAAGTVGASWMTREDRLFEIDDYVRYLDSVHGCVLERIDCAVTSVHVLGFSQGAATAARWVARGSVQADRLILWSGLVPPELDHDQLATRLGGGECLLVSGEKDRIVPSGAVGEQAAMLEAAGVRVTTVTHPAGHEIVGEVLEALLLRRSP